MSYAQNLLASTESKVTATNTATNSRSKRESGERKIGAPVGGPRRWTPALGRTGIAVVGR
jgi:hypothetical protein